jgi:putative ABC transport system ATP-binding protein
MPPPSAPERLREDRENAMRTTLDLPPPVLVARGVTKTYWNGTVGVSALRGIDLVVDRAEFVAVMGPSGSGKTTLVNCLSGLDEIDGGTVVVEGEDIHAMPDARRTAHRARHMGFVFQSFNLIPVFSAQENVELPLLLIGERPADARERARAMLARVGLGHRVGHRPAELSGGEQQRVAIARALVAEPALVWADEPTGNLDSEMAASVMDLLREVNDAGQSLVVVTHDPAIGASAPRLVRMRDGLVVSDEAAGHVAVAWAR